MILGDLFESNMKRVMDTVQDFVQLTDKEFTAHHGVSPVTWVKQNQSLLSSIADQYPAIKKYIPAADDHLFHEDAMVENLRKWFREKWVRFNPQGKIMGPCARGSDKEGKPKCLPQAKAHALGKKKRAAAAAKKRREDPNPERRGAAKNVSTKVQEGIANVKKMFQDYAELYYLSHEGWDDKIGAEEYSKNVERKMDQIESQIWREFGNKGVEKLEQYAHDQFWGKNKQGVAEGRAFIKPEDPTAAVKKFSAYVQKNINDLASMASFEADHSDQPYVDERLEGFLTRADGQPVTPIFNLGGELKLVGPQRQYLNIPTEMYYTYRGFMYGGLFAKNILKALGYTQGVTEGWSNKMVARRTGQAPTPYSVFIKGQEWKSFPDDDHAENVANKLRAKFKQEGKDPSVITIAPTGYDKGIEEAQTDYQKRRQRERDVDAGRPVTKQRQPRQTDYQKRRAQQKREMELGEDQDTSGVESAIIRRIMMAHTDLLRQFGPEKVMQAAEEVAYNVGDVDEIGTSDVSAYVNQVRQILGADTEVREESQQDRNARIIAGEIEDAAKQGNDQLVKQKIKELIGVGYTLNRDGELQRMGMYEESQLQEKQDACYRKVKSRYKVWPSAYASGALVQCRKKGAANWGTGGKKK